MFNGDVKFFQCHVVEKVKLGKGLKQWTLFCQSKVQHWLKQYFILDTDQSLKLKPSTFNTEMWKKYVNRNYSDALFNNDFFLTYEIFPFTNKTHHTLNYSTKVDFIKAYEKLLCKINHWFSSLIDTKTALLGLNWAKYYG